LTTDLAEEEITSVHSKTESPWNTLNILASLD